MLKISVVIPTLQKNIELLNNLVRILEKDDSVSEIIVIDNSTNGYCYKSEKLRVIVPKENLFVNPSWNLGVNEAKEEIVALLNDDITIPNNFCKDIVSQINKDMGIVGFHRDFIENTHVIMPTPQNTGVKLVKATGRCGYFGVAMFFYKTSYYKIPEDMKIFWGDDWLYFWNKTHRANNYFITNQKIYHYDGLSSTDKKLNPYAKHDSKLYRKYTHRWWNYIFNIEPVFRGFRLTILGIELLYHFNKKH